MISFAEKRGPEYSGLGASQSNRRDACPTGVWSRTGILPVTSSARNWFHTANPLLEGNAKLWPARRARTGVASEIQFDKVMDCDES